MFSIIRGQTHRSAPTHTVIYSIS